MVDERASLRSKAEARRREQDAERRRADTEQQDAMQAKAAAEPKRHAQQVARSLLPPDLGPKLVSQLWQSTVQTLE